MATFQYWERKIEELEKRVKALEQEPCDDEYQADMDEAWEQAKQEEYEKAYDDYLALVNAEQEPKVTTTSTDEPMVMQYPQVDGITPTVVKAEPCDDVVSRQAVLASIKNLYPDMPIMDIMGARRKWLDKYGPYFECEKAVEQLPSVRPKPETVTEFADRCRECGARYGRLLKQKQQEREEKK